MNEPRVTHQELIDTLRQTAYALGADLPVRLRAHRAAMELAERAEAQQSAAQIRRAITIDMREWEANEIGAPADERFCGGGR